MSRTNTSLPLNESDSDYENETNGGVDNNNELENLEDLDSVLGSDEENETVYSVGVKEMLTVYERKVRIKASVSVKSEILRLVRRLVIPCVKFTTDGNHIGSFERPDFTQKDTWYYVVLSKAGFDNHSPRTLAKVWVTYRKDVAEAFSNHRSYVTACMKKAFMAGKLVIFILHQNHV